MNNSIIAWKTRVQLDDFMLKMFHGFSRPAGKFIRDMVYGIQTTGDTILTDIARAIDSGRKHRNAENRLSRNLQAEGLAADIQNTVTNDAKRFVDRNTLVLATAYFTAAWLGRGVRKEVLVAHIERMHQRFNEVPEFFPHAHSC